MISHLPQRVCALVVAVLLASACTDDAAAWMEFVASRSAAAGDASDAQAERLLLELVRQPVPPSVAAEDRRVVHQDAYDRLARIALGRGDRPTAERHVAAGLALGVRDDLFSANLLTTRGQIHEARGQDREAAADYHLALRISESLLDRVLSGDAR